LNEAFETEILMGMKTARYNVTNRIEDFKISLERVAMAVK
jgi:hypothetical protein